MFSYRIDVTVSAEPLLALVLYPDTKGGRVGLSSILLSDASDTGELGAIAVRVLSAVASGGSASALTPYFSAEGSGKPRLSAWHAFTRAPAIGEAVELLPGLHIPAGQPVHVALPQPMALKSPNALVVELRSSHGPRRVRGFVSVTD